MATAINAAGAAHGESARSDKALIADANKVSSGIALRRLGIVVGKGNRFECPTCLAHPPSATFADPDGSVMSRWRCTSCDGGGSLVELVVAGLLSGPDGLLDGIQD